MWTDAFNGTTCSSENNNWVKEYNNAFWTQRFACYFAEIICYSFLFIMFLQYFFDLDLHGKKSFEVKSHVLPTYAVLQLPIYRPGLASSKNVNHGCSEETNLPSTIQKLSPKTHIATQCMPVVDKSSRNGRYK